MRILFFFYFSMALKAQEKLGLQEKFVSFDTVNSVRIHCQESSCLAKTLIKSTDLKPVKMKVSPSENPASLFCKQKTGEPIILEDEKKNEISVCILKDKSMFVTWDLIKKLQL